MWSATLPEGYESRKCRYRVNTLCRGIGLDLSATEEKIQDSAIGIGKEIQLDLSANNALEMFSDDFFDYVYDAHQLGNFNCTKAVLAEWWRVVKAGGYLILYEQDKEYYPHAGTPGSTSKRKKDLLWQDAWDILESFGNAEKVSSSRHNDSNEYSWQLVVRKTVSITTDPSETVSELEGQVCFPRKKKSDKEVLVIRYGALGDSLWVTPVLSKLKKDGYYVVMNCTVYGARVLKNNPNIDEFIIQESGTSAPYTQKGQYWEEISKGFDRVINLTQSIEGSLVKCEGSEEYEWSHEKRHKECNVNFQDRTMELAGYPDEKGCLPEMYFTDIEEHLAENFSSHHKDKFTMIWGLAGSAFHKVYPWAEYVAGELACKYKDIEIITVGDDACRILEWQNPRTINKSGVWTVRQSYIMTKHVDLVIGPDTGLMNAASCFDTPKILLAGSNSEENLNKYWKNTQALYADDCECSPCHKLIVTNSCPKGTIQGVGTKCMEHIKPEDVLDAISRVYLAWKSGRTEDRNKERVVAFTIADDELTHRLAGRVRNSFDKFHHDVPFYVYDANDEMNLLGEIKDSTCACKAFEIRPRLMSLLLKDYDRVIYLDADTVVTGPLTEMMEGEYDVYGSLNVGDESSTYLNAGVSACTSKEFCDEWVELMYSPEGGKSNQVHFNNLVDSGRYTCKILDKEDVYYNERSRKHWKDLTVDEDGFHCNGRKVKVLHWAGGIPRMKDKLSSSDFSLLVKETLDDLTDTKDFTEIEGCEVSSW